MWLWTFDSFGYIITCLFRRKATPVKNTENIEGAERKEDQNAAVMSYATLHDANGRHMYDHVTDNVYDSPYRYLHLLIIILIQLKNQWRRNCKKKQEAYNSNLTCRIQFALTSRCVVYCDIAPFAILTPTGPIPWDASCLPFGNSFTR